LTEPLIQKAKGESKQEEKKGGIRGKKHSPLMELLNLQRVNNIGILLSQFKVPLEEVIGAIWRMDESALSLENLKALRYIAPKDDEVFVDPVAPTTTAAAITQYCWLKLAAAFRSSPL
jgi:hypothetical protein